MNYDKFKILKELNMINPESDNFYDQSIMIKFVITTYHVILVLTGNDIGPVTINMYIINIVLLICGALMNANIFGTLVSIFQQINIKALKFQERID